MNKKNHIQKITLIALLSAIVACSRLICIIPNAKPVTALLILIGMSFGPLSGFLTGIISCIISNFFLEWGPWSLFQIISFSLIGLISGILLYKKSKISNIKISIFGFLITFIIYASIMNISSVWMMSEEISLTKIIIYISAAFPLDLIHAGFTAIFLFLLSNTILKVFNKTEHINLFYSKN